MRVRAPDVGSLRPAIRGSGVPACEGFCHWGAWRFLSAGVSAAESAFRADRVGLEVRPPRWPRLDLPARCYAGRVKRNPASAVRPALSCHGFWHVCVPQPGPTRGEAAEEVGGCFVLAGHVQDQTPDAAWVAGVGAGAKPGRRASADRHPGPALQVSSDSRGCFPGTVPQVRRVAAVDAAYAPDGSSALAAAVVYDLERNAVLESCFAASPCVRPYVPGEFWQREGALALDALGHLQEWVDVVFCDAHGTAHPRRYGLACWLEAHLSWPVVGCAKSRLVGSHRTLPDEAGSWVPLEYNSETIGAVVRTRTGVRPLFVSPGGRWSIEASVQAVLSACRGFRIPEPLRTAHQFARRALDSRLSHARRRE